MKFAIKIEIDIPPDHWMHREEGGAQTSLFNLIDLLLDEEGIKHAITKE